MYIQESAHISKLDDDLLSFYKAIGVDRIHLELRSGAHRMNAPIAHRLKMGIDCTSELEAAREAVERHGMTLNNIFMPCWEEIVLQTEAADERIDAWRRMLESMGRAGIPNLGWNFKPMGNFRTTSATGRGGAKYSTFDYEEFQKTRPAPRSPEVSEEAMWAGMERFLKAVIPAAEKAGVRMALHPDDPPVPEPLGGIAQICSTVEQFRRILEIQPSPCHALLFCQGCFTELLGPDGLYDTIAEFARNEKIAWVHFRNVRGRIPRFSEVFIDEGDVDMRRAMEVFRDNGFRGPFMMDHTPRFTYDDIAPVGKAYAIGYIRALIQVVYGS